MGVIKNCLLGMRIGIANLMSHLCAKDSTEFVLVEGNVEGFCGIRQNGGLIIVKGGALRGVGAEMAGVTIIVGGKIQRFAPGFEFVSVENKVTSGDIELIGEFKKFTGDYAISKRAKGALYVSANANPEL